MGTIRAFVKVPGTAGTMKRIENNDETLKQLVGGEIRNLFITDELVAVVNEAGALLDLSYNCTIGRVPLRGTVVLVGLGKNGYKNVGFSVADCMFICGVRA